eukprot:958817_1
MLEKLFKQNRGFNKVKKNKVQSAECEWSDQEANNNNNESDNDTYHQTMPQNITYEVETLQQMTDTQYDRDKALNYIADELLEAQQKINALSNASKQKKKKKKYKKLKTEKVKKMKKSKEDKMRSKSVPNIKFKKQDDDKQDDDKQEDEKELDEKELDKIERNDYWDILWQNENDYLWSNNENIIGLKRRNKNNNKKWISCFGRKIIKKGEYMRWDINILPINYDSIKKKNKKNKKKVKTAKTMIGIVDVDTLRERGRSIMSEFWVLPYFGYGFGGEKGKKYHITADGQEFTNKYKIGDVISVEL